MIPVFLQVDFFLMFTEIFVNFSIMRFEACLHCLDHFLLTSRCGVKHSKIVIFRVYSGF